METFLAANGVAADAVTVIGFHGQTVLHRPERGLTIQIGDGGLLAARLGIPMVYDFRAADIAAGGQGAPLAPVLHRALVRRLDFAPPVAVLNIGGVANVTFIDGEDLIACNRDRAMLRSTISCGCAPAGCSTPTAAPRRPVSSTRPPSPASWRIRSSENRRRSRSTATPSAFAGVGAALDDRSVEDGAATLTELTAAAVARIVPLLPRAPKTWIVAGGGARNPTLMRMLAQRLAPARVGTGALGRLVGLLARGASHRLSRGAQHSQLADHAAGNDRRPASAHRRRAGAAVIVEGGGAFSLPLLPPSGERAPSTVGARRARGGARPHKIWHHLDAAHPLATARDLSPLGRGENEHPFSTRSRARKVCLRPRTTRLF